MDTRFFQPPSSPLTPFAKGTFDGDSSYCRDRERSDGYGHGAGDGARRPRNRPHEDDPRQRRGRQAEDREGPPARRREAALHARGAGRDPRPPHLHEQGRRSREVRPHHRIGDRGPRREEAPLREPRRRGRRAGDLRVEYLDALHHGARRGDQAPDARDRPPLLQPGSGHEARRDRADAQDRSRGPEGGAGVHGQGEEDRRHDP